MQEAKIRYNNIIKALECCLKDEINICNECPYDKLCEKNPDAIMLDAKAELERLKGLYEDTQNQCWDGIGLMHMLRRKTKTAKSEAIKEFTEEFEKRCISGGIYPAFVKQQLHDIKKEMMETLRSTI